MRRLGHFTLLAMFLLGGCGGPISEAPDPPVIRNRAVGRWTNVHAGDPELAGVYVQQFPDCLHEAAEHEGRHPAMIIYVFRNARARQMTFAPDGTVREDFWWDVPPQHWLWEQLDRPAGAPRPQREASPGILEEASQSEFGSGAYACDDTVHLARACGVDYRQVVAGCLARDPAAMHHVFWLSTHAGFDAASAQGHAAVLGVLLRRLGDDFFAECLLREPAETQAEVRSALLYDAGYGNGSDGDVLQALRARHRKTFPPTVAPD